MAKVTTSPTWSEVGWHFPLEKLYPETKQEAAYQNFIKMEGESISFEVVGQEPVVTWWHVYDYPNGWGFKTVNGWVKDVAPQGLHLKNKSLIDARAWSIETGIKIVKVK